MPEASLPPFLGPIPGFHMATRAKFGLESLGLRLRLGYAYLLYLNLLVEAVSIYIYLLL